MTPDELRAAVGNTLAKAEWNSWDYNETADAIIALVLEEAARVCDELEDAWTPDDPSAYQQGQGDAAAYIAEQLRAMIPGGPDG